MGDIYEIEKYHNASRIFKDRIHAGNILADMLKPRYGPEDRVMAIPAGGVPVGIAVAETLGCPFDMVVVRKLKIPGNTEAGFGAMTPDGNIFLNETLLQELNLTQHQIQQEAERVKQELEARNQAFRKGRPFPVLKEKNVILVDDGLASGYTMKSAISLMKENGSSEITVAVPTAPLRTIESIAPDVDHIYCANIREVMRFAVADAYQNWRDLDEEEVMDLLSIRP